MITRVRSVYVQAYVCLVNERFINLEAVCQVTVSQVVEHWRVWNRGEVGDCGIPIDRSRIQCYLRVQGERIDSRRHVVLNSSINQDTKALDVLILRHTDMKRGRVYVVVEEVAGV